MMPSFSRVHRREAGRRGAGHSVLGAPVRVLLWYSRQETAMQKIQLRDAYALVTRGRLLRRNRGIG